MGMYWKSSHSVYDCRYHIVWITKYRREVLSKEMQKRLEVVIRGVCNEMRVRVIRIGMESDHVHLYLMVPPVQPIPYLLKILKGRSSKVLRKEFSEELMEYYWKPVLWAVGYFVATVGSVDDKVIERYVEEQGKRDVDEECIELKATDIVRGQKQ